MLWTWRKVGATKNLPQATERGDRPQGDEDQAADQRIPPRLRRPRPLAPLLVRDHPPDQRADTLRRSGFVLLVDSGSHLGRPQPIMGAQSTSAGDTPSWSGVVRRQCDRLAGDSEWQSPNRRGGGGNSRAGRRRNTSATGAGQPPPGADGHARTRAERFDHHERQRPIHFGRPVETHGPTVGRPVIRCERSTAASALRRHSSSPPPNRRRDTTMTRDSPRGGRDRAGDARPRHRDTERTGLAWGSAAERADRQLGTAAQVA